MSVAIDLDHKTFRIVANDGPGAEVNEETVFHFRQDGDVAHADYFGGGVRAGKLRLIDPLPGTRLPGFPSGLSPKDPTYQQPGMSYPQPEAS